MRRPKWRGLWLVVFVAGMAAGGCDGNLFREIEPLGDISTGDVDPASVDVEQEEPTDAADVNGRSDTEQRDAPDGSSSDADATDSDTEDGSDGGGSVCESPSCPGTDTACGCRDCVDCTDKDGWYIERSYDCCHQGESCTCVVQKNREYFCGGDNSCIYTTTGTDMFRRNCRSCDDGAACTDNFCQNGTCQSEPVADGTSCAEGTCCNGRCANTSTDPDHCGFCDKACSSPSPDCLAGQCGCAPDCRQCPCP